MNLKFSPEIFLQDSDLSTSVAFFADVDPDQLVINAGSVDIPKTGQAMVCELRIDGESIVLSVNQGAERHDIASIAWSSEIVTEDRMPLEKLRTVLNHQVQQEFFRARKSLFQPAPAPAAHITPVQPVETMSITPTPEVKAGRFASFKGLATKRNAMIATLLVAGSMVAYGALRPKAPEDAFRDALAQGNYADLQQKIREQVAAAGNGGDPSAFNLQGANVAIETMKAMGLDPGKANAGCLVGVK